MTMSEPDHRSDTLEWLQLDVALDSRCDDPREAAWSAVERWWHALDDDASSRPRFAWLLRKPPGLRLRVSVDADARWLQLEPRLCAGDAPGRWSRGIYEPEHHRFGGPAGSTIAHAMLTAATRGWIAWESLRRRDETELDASVVALAIYDDFVRRVTSDVPEQWDVWCRLAQQYYGVIAAPGVGRRSGLDLGQICARGSTQERRIIDEMRDHNARCADDLTRALRSGATRIGPRAFAVTLATFHWNIWAVDRPTLRRALALMISELDPVPELRAP
jgi:thiopeptide-type bacteriocin biosynthesis protein